MALHLTRPADSVASVLQAAYAPEVSSSTGELSLQTSADSVTQLSQVLEKLSESNPSLQEPVFGSDANKVKAWVDRVASGVSKEQLKSLDDEIKGSTFLVGATQTAADTAVCAALFPHIKAASHDERLQFPSLTRFVDLIQHSSVLSQVYGNQLISVDLDNVPLTAHKPEAKPKKEKAPPKDAQPEKKEVAAAEQGQKKKKEPKAKGEAAPKKDKKAAAAPADNTPAPHMVDLRVGKIVKVERHPDADSLYVEQIDLGEESGPRTVVSGLVKYVPIEQMQDRYLIAVCNLKPASMRGVKSFAMVLCASAKEGKDGGVEIVEVPEGSNIGDRVYFEGMEEQQPLEVLNPKKKIFETVQPGFTTLDNKECAWVDPKDQKVYRIRTEKGCVLEICRRATTASPQTQPPDLAAIIAYGLGRRCCCDCYE